MHRSLRSRWSLLLGCALALGPAACGDGSAPAAGELGSQTPVAGPVLVDSGQVAVLRRDRTIVSVAPDGRLIGRLGTLLADAGEPDAVAVSGGGRLVLVSAVTSDDDDPSVCTGSVLQVLPGGGVRRLAAGAAMALSRDGQQLAYFRYATVDGYCRRTDLVVRDLTDGVEMTITTLEEGPTRGNPPEWPVNWSPDGTQIAHVVQEGVVVTDVKTRTTTLLGGTASRRVLAPAWLPDGRLVLLDGCCIGGASVRTADQRELVFPVPAPVRSIRAQRDGPGAWVTVEEQGLHYWDGQVLRQVTADAALTSR